MIIWFVMQRAWYYFIFIWLCKEQAFCYHTVCIPCISFSRFFWVHLIILTKILIKDGSTLKAMSVMLRLVPTLAPHTTFSLTFWFPWEMYQWLEAVRKSGEVLSRTLVWVTGGPGPWDTLSLSFIKHNYVQVSSWWEELGQDLGRLLRHVCQLV